MKVDSLQYNACLATTGAIRGLSKEKLYQELGFESLQQRRWYGKLYSFYKAFKKESLRYLLNLIPIKKPSCITRSQANIPLFKTDHKLLKKRFFTSTIIEWNDLDPNLLNSDTNETFKNTVLKFLRPSPSNVFICHNPQGIKFLTRLRLELRHRHEYKFKHSFQDSLILLCKCCFDVESISCFLLHCPIYNNDHPEHYNKY